MQKLAPPLAFAEFYAAKSSNGAAASGGIEFTETVLLDRMKEKRPCNICGDALNLYCVGIISSQEQPVLLRLQPLQEQQQERLRLEFLPLRYVLPVQ